ncbi:MAG: ribosome biogenesis GTPase Der [Gammaproteobacteria bacterium]|nr:ribosome biogenesis GTPase Der [Gammaproteobacteria bacterium]MDE0440755.1 ribosome biogenesis GTPase Der [Gammaproteobacteria bacterium]
MSETQGSSQASAKCGAGHAVVALVGRPNVGKSTIFNRLCGARDALVADLPGLTRDRRYGRAILAGRTVTLVDTGGLTHETGSVYEQMSNQAMLAIREADVAVFVTDAREGLAAADEDIARDLRKRGKAVVVAVNKVDGVPAAAVHEFAALGFGDCCPVSAAHGRGMVELAHAVAVHLPETGVADEADPPGIRVAVVGRPNVGKSTLINRILGEERQVVDSSPGTTRDSIDIPFGDYLLIDTAGVRRRGRVESGPRMQRAVEKFSIVKTLATLERAQVAVVVVDAREGVVEQDLHVLDYAIDRGAGIVLAVNKWDGLNKDERSGARTSVERRLAFAPWIPLRYISALHGRGVKSLLGIVSNVYRAGEFDVQTGELNRILAAATSDHPPPMVQGRAIKLRYAHKGGDHPPTVVVHGNRTEALPDSYRRYLVNRYRDELDLVGVPVRLETRTTRNPYAHRRNELTRRQIKRRRRVIRYGSS